MDRKNSKESAQKESVAETLVMFLIIGKKAPVKLYRVLILTVFQQDLQNPTKSHWTAPRNQPT